MWKLKERIYWGISTQHLDTKWGSAERYQGNTHPVERYWRGGQVAFDSEILRNTWGSAEKYQGYSVIGDWSVFSIT